MHTYQRWLWATFLLPVGAWAQSDAHQSHEAHSRHQQHHSATMHDHSTMRGMLGPYSMTREASGTSWQPELAPMSGPMFERGSWSLMAHGFVNLIYDDQGGPRGDEKTFASSMAMLMAQRLLGDGTLGLRAMVSLDPLTMGKSGYPLLFQTGETADGRTPLIDRQHPHDAFMELATSYSVPFSERGSAFVYLGLPGEPALGPPAFMHRFSGMRNPEAPLTHHWLDSTHITFGVATLGVINGPLKIEGSWFNGREPDQSRWNIETRKFDSWSARLSFNPTANWSAQVSYGDLDSPEQLEPDTSIRRTTASLSYHMRTGDDQWQGTAAWGRNDKRGGDHAGKFDGWLLEFTYVRRSTHTFFGRLERVENDELFPDPASPLHDRTFNINKLSLGYIYDFARLGPVTLGVGGLVSAYRKPSELDAAYGRRPISYMVFLQGRL